MTMPQEIEVWYLIPALRRELAKVFVSKYKLSQKGAAQILGITEAAVSQYLKAKRGWELKFSAKDSALIRKHAALIVKDKKTARQHLYALCRALSGSRSICAVHRRYDKSLPPKCTLCSKGR
ncbi:MAG: hypothetical protein V1735_01300 [Nanoarchaeota archaeon]